MSTVKLNNAAFRAIRQSAGVQAALNREATAMAQRANALAASQCDNPGHRHFTAVPDRTTDRGSIALVSTGSDAGTMAHESAHGTLEKSIT